MIGNFIAVLNFKRLFLKLDQLIFNQLSVFPDRCPNVLTVGRNNPYIVSVDLRQVFRPMFKIEVFNTSL